MVSHGNFFHHFWDLVKEDMLDIVEISRNMRGVLKSFNPPFLTLIAKEERVDTPNKFRLIALCSIIYKIISKVIANSIKPLISSEQSSFVEGR